MNPLVDSLPGWHKVTADGVQLVWTDAAVPPALYAELEAAWPAQPASAPDYIRRKDVLAADIAAVWREFWAGLLHPDSLTTLLDFWDLGRHALPSYRAQAAAARRFETRGVGKAPFVVAPSFTWREPRKVDPVISPHFDSPSSLCYLLWYFPVPHDTAPGGDLLFLRPKVASPTRPTDFDIRLVIPYRPNIAVFVLNSREAVHAVVPRVGAKHPRRHIGLTIDIEEKLFEKRGRRLLPLEAWTVEGVSQLLNRG